MFNILELTYIIPVLVVQELFNLQCLEYKNESLELLLVNIQSILISVQKYNIVNKKI